MMRMPKTTNLKRGNALCGILYIIEDQIVFLNAVLRSRERNRAHARQTRLRKKNYLDALKSRLLALQEEVRSTLSFLRLSLEVIALIHFLGNSSSAACG